MAHDHIAKPSEWIRRHVGLVPGGGPVLDVAAGHGRHSRLMLDLGHPVTAVDRDIGQLGALAAARRLEAIEADLEDGSPWPLGERRFAGVIVANYLWRPLLSRLVGAVAAGGVLIYETFAAGNEAFGRPSNPDFLLRPGELLVHCQGRLNVVAYESGVVALGADGVPAVVQRVCAARSRQPQKIG